MATVHAENGEIIEWQCWEMVFRSWDQFRMTGYFKAQKTAQDTQATTAACFECPCCDWTSENRRQAHAEDALATHLRDEMQEAREEVWDHL